MKILFVGKRSFDESSGVEKKLNGEIAAFENLGNEVWYTAFDKDGAWLVSKAKKKLLFSKKNNGILGGYVAYERAIQRSLSASGVDFDFCYIRKALCSPMHIASLRQLKQRGVRIVEEIPTFPYDAEYEKASGIVPKIWLAIDRLFRNRMKRYLDGIATFDMSDLIFGVPTIKISNGIDASLLPLHKMPKDDGILNVISVSKTAYWHGIDRFIVGLSQYIKEGGKTRVTLHIVGEGPETEKLKKLTSELDVEHSVIFYGELWGEKLDEVFKVCSVALSSIAIHRKNVIFSAELKNREYMARGIPFVFSAKDMLLPKEANYFYKISEDDTAVDIKKIVEFYETIRRDDTVAKQMRDYALEYMSWEIQMKKVLEFLRIKRNN